MTNQYLDTPIIPSPHHFVSAEVHSAIIAHQYTKTASAFALSEGNKEHGLSFQVDVESCFSSLAENVDEDYALWQECIKGQARQIYLFEKSGDKSENEAARAAIQFIHKKATAK